MNNETLRAVAQSIVFIPEHYKLVMEDSIPSGAEKRRCFIWENPHNDDERIEIMLDIRTGELHSLDIDETEEAVCADNVSFRLSLDEAKAAAERFLIRHSLIRAGLSLTQIEEGRKHAYFIYRQQVGGIPLPYSGCELRVNEKLAVTRYRSGKDDSDVPVPEWPGEIQHAGLVISEALERTSMKLMLAELSPALHEISESGDGLERLRLVYSPEPELHMIDAVTGNNLFGLEHYRMPASHPIASSAKLHEGAMLPDPSSDAMDIVRFYEERLGISNEHYIREQHGQDRQEIKFFYYDKNLSGEVPLERDERSMDGYMERKWGDKLRRLDAAYMLQLERETFRIIGFMRKGIPAADGEKRAAILTREQCWDKAQQFLSIVFPAYSDFLQLEEREQGSEPDEREFFHLPLFAGGIPVDHERATVSVCKSSGQILLYMGISFELIDQLIGREYSPAIPSAEAKSLYAAHMAAKLRWFQATEDGPPSYRLIYDVKAGEGRRLIYVDACTGELIWERALRKR